VAALIVGGAVFRLSADHPVPAPAPRPSASPSPVALAVPMMLHGTPLRPGDAPGTLLFLGGEDLRLLPVSQRTPALTVNAVPYAGDARNPLGSDATVQQVIAVAGGVVALVDSDGPGDLPDVGDVLFVPVGAHGAGQPRVIARANYMVAAPDGRDVWVEQAGAPWGNGPASSPAWLADPAGGRLSGVRSLNDRALVAATTRGLLVQSPDHTLALMNQANGHAESTPIPTDAVIAGTDKDQVAWQTADCPADCSLHVTDVGGGQDTQIALPPHTVIDPNDTSDFDPAGQRLALPLDTTDSQGTVTSTSVYVASLATRTLTKVPGGPVLVAALPPVLGAFPAGSPDVVSARWSAGGLWIVATDGLYFQAGYWNGHNPLRVLTPQAGLAYRFAIPGPA